MSSSSRKNSTDSPTLPLSASPRRAILIQSATRTSIQSLHGARLQKHADYQRAYANAPQAPIHFDELVSGAPDAAAAGSALPPGPRVGLTAGKVLGKAHERNRIKRRMRDILRRHVELLPQGCDLILHPRRIVLTLEFAKLEAEVVRILHQARSEAERMPQEVSAR